MDTSKRKLVVMDLALAFIVLALFALAPTISDSRNANPDLIKIGSDAGSGSDGGTSGIPLSLKHLLFRVSMETTSGSTLLPDYVSKIEKY